MTYTMDESLESGKYFLSPQKPGESAMSVINRRRIYIKINDLIDAGVDPEYAHGLRVKLHKELIEREKGSAK